MEIEIDHYQVLGLPSGKEGAKLTSKEIGKVYKEKALKLHTDKRRNDLKSPAEFQRIKSSYNILSDEKAQREASASDDITKAGYKENMIAMKLKEEINRIRVRHGRNATTGIATSKVIGSWIGADCADELKELFGKYEDVEDVDIRSRGSKRKITRSVFVVMASKEAVASKL
ncbi:hypothetical protein GIB67_020924 [Kingdonia uniflora]|uniref:J domain-containing protein n=1 Tax=Kingdonia uniflora TaxID=39325 RepID=A0A7J7M7G8_9MAGN|nr:hypothetical protein GIB67_020924 [Kingdonia uniflora]